VATSRGALLDPALLHHAFRHLQERLVVMTRGAFDANIPSTIASARRVPVLLLEPAGTVAAAEPAS
jgi:hypothetical protein